MTTLKELFDRLQPNPFTCYCGAYREDTCECGQWREQREKKERRDNYI